MNVGRLQPCDLVLEGDPERGDSLPEAAAVPVGRTACFITMLPILMCQGRQDDQRGMAWKCHRTVSYVARTVPLKNKLSFRERVHMWRSRDNLWALALSLYQEWNPGCHQVWWPLLTKLKRRQGR